METFSSKQGATIKRRYNYGSPLFCESLALIRGTLGKTVEVKLFKQGLIRTR